VLHILSILPSPAMSFISDILLLVSMSALSSKQKRVTMVMYMNSGILRNDHLSFDTILNGSKTTLTQNRTNKNFR
jgi:hypothetical protein